MAAYEQGELRGGQFMRVRQLIDRRRALGKGNSRYSKKTDPKATMRTLVQTFETEVRRQRILVKKTDIAEQRLLFGVTAMRRLPADEHFRTLLRAERIGDMPKLLAEHLAPQEGTP